MENVNADALSRLNTVEVSSKCLFVLDEINNIEGNTDLIPMLSKEEIICKQTQRMN